eukprot:4117256-Pyramimonas_sp.AAC.1
MSSAARPHYLHSLTTPTGGGACPCVQQHRPYAPSATSICDITCCLDARLGTCSSVCMRTFRQQGAFGPTIRSSTPKTRLERLPAEGAHSHLAERDYPIRSFR